MVAVASVRLLARVGSGGPVVVDPPPSGGTVGVTGPTSYAPALIPLSDPEIPNSYRGQTEWLSQPLDPPGWPGLDIYRRPDSAWKTIETSKGVYNWSSVDSAIAAAEAKGGRLSYRVMPMRDWGNGVSWPAYLPTLTRSGTSYPYPDWNSAAYVQAWCGLVAAMGARYDKNPRLFSVDLSGWTMFGEHLWDTGYGPAITSANMRTIMEATRDAFPNTFVIAPAWGLGTPAQDLMIPVFGAGGKWGHRYDNLGGTNVVQWMDYSGNAWANQWKSGPVFGEWSFNNGSGAVTMDAGLQNVQKLHVSSVSSPRKDGAEPDIVHNNLSAADQQKRLTLLKTAGFRLSLTSVGLPATWEAGQQITVKTTWKNDGVAPTYDNWQVKLLVGDTPVTLPVDLRQVLPGTKTFTSTVTAPTARGNTLAVRMDDPAAYLAPLRLANTGRQADGRYPL